MDFERKRIDHWVRDEKGAPVAGVTPRIRTPSGNEVWPNYSVILEEWGGTYTGDMYRRVTQTDDAGVNVRRHVPPGPYEVTVWSRGYEAVESLEIEVASRRTTDVEVVVRPLETREVLPPGGKR